LAPRSIISDVLHRRTWCPSISPTSDPLTWLVSSNGERKGWLMVGRG